MGVIKEFKEFAIKGNVIDMAVGIIIGAAFGKIVASLVDDILMPPIGYLLEGVDFTSLKYVMVEQSIADNGEVLNPGVSINYGNFIQICIHFILVAFAVFLLIRTINRLKRKQEAKDQSAPGVIVTEIGVLTEIRDLLKDQPQK